eukprot:GHVU01018444.1.p1 GENE.GHVU01018444.1~~GHVU01018444.1.p1  ORF type:complete len:406 (-),score=42.73 GHVU01018444.1:1390-2607(-)
MHGRIQRLYTRAHVGACGRRIACMSVYACVCACLGSGLLQIRCRYLGVAAFETIQSAIAFALLMEAAGHYERALGLWGAVLFRLTERRMSGEAHTQYKPHNILKMIAWPIHDSHFFGWHEWGPPYMLTQGSQLKRHLGSKKDLPPEHFVMMGPTLIKERIIRLYFNKVAPRSLQARVYQLFLALNDVEQREGAAESNLRSGTLLGLSGTAAAEAAMEAIHGYPTKATPPDLVEGDAADGIIAFAEPAQLGDLRASAGRIEAAFERLVADAERDFDIASKRVQANKWRKAAPAPTVMEGAAGKQEATMRRGLMTLRTMTAGASAASTSKLAAIGFQVEGDYEEEFPLEQTSIVARLNLRSQTIDVLCGILYYFVEIKNFLGFWYPREAHSQESVDVTFLDPTPFER